MSFIMLRKFSSNSNLSNDCTLYLLEDHSIFLLHSINGVNYAYFLMPSPFAFLKKPHLTITHAHGVHGVVPLKAFSTKGDSTGANSWMLSADLSLL